jgi:hypothetical protein
MTGFALLHHLNNKRLGERQREREIKIVLDSIADWIQHTTVQ